MYQLHFITINPELNHTVVDKQSHYFKFEMSITAASEGHVAVHYNTKLFEISLLLLFMYSCVCCGNRKYHIIYRFKIF